MICSFSVLQSARASKLRKNSSIIQFKIGESAVSGCLCYNPQELNFQKIPGDLFSAF